MISSVCGCGLVRWLCWARSDALLGVGSGMLFRWVQVLVRFIASCCLGVRLIVVAVCDLPR